MADKHARAFESDSVAAVFAAMNPSLRRKLLNLRSLIFATAEATPGVGAIEEALRWNEPSYLTTETRSGSLIRLNIHKPGTQRYAIYFHCKTTLVSTFRALYGDTFSFDGNRAITFALSDRVPIRPLRHCIELALTYHVSRLQ